MSEKSLVSGEGQLWPETQSRTGDTKTDVTQRWISPVGSKVTHPPLSLQSIFPHSRSVLDVFSDCNTETIWPKFCLVYLKPVPLIIVKTHPAEQKTCSLPAAREQGQQSLNAGKTNQKRERGVQVRRDEGGALAGEGRKCLMPACEGVT